MRNSNVINRNRVMSVLASVLTSVLAFGSISYAYTNSCDSLPESVVVEDWKHSMKPILIQEADALLKQDRIQEAIWNLTEAGEIQRAEILRRKLLRTLQSPKLLEAKPSGAKVSASKTLKIKITPTISGFFKPLQNAQQSAALDVAAYELDQLLKLNMVPATLLASVNGIEGARSYLVKGVRTPFDPGVDPKRQNRNMRFFDALIANWDRHENNFLIGPDGRLIAIDHNSAFTRNHYEPVYPGEDLKCLCIENDKARETNDPRFIEAIKRVIPTHDLFVRLKKLSDETIRRRLKPYLSDEALEALLIRKHKIINDINWVTHNGCDMDLFAASWESHL